MMINKPLDRFIRKQSTDFGGGIEGVAFEFGFEIM